MIQEKTIIDQIELLTCGRVQLRIHKLVTNGDNVLAQSSPHRTAFDPSTPVEAQLAAVNANLVKDLGWPALDKGQSAYIKAVVQGGRAQAKLLAGKADAHFSASARAKRIEAARQLEQRANEETAAAR